MPDADADNSEDRLSRDDLTELVKCFREVLDGTVSTEVLFDDLLRVICCHCKVSARNTVTSH